MIVCPNCNHQNPDGAVQCEACYTPLPAMTTCPNCGSTVQADASFCGQCGFNLKTAAKAGNESAPPPTITPDFAIPDLQPPEALVLPEPLVENISAADSPEPDSLAPDSASEIPPFSEPPPPSPFGDEPPASTPPEPPVMPPPAVAGSPVSIPASPPSGSRTQLQVPSARLLHVQTDTLIELPSSLSVIHIGKPNDRIPPDIDVSGYPDSEIVSRIHADIRVEGDAHYLEDVGSSNGTYINNAPLPMGNRHRLRTGDRIALGKGDRVTFLFQSS